MNKLARYHLVWAIILSAITLTVLGFAVVQWFKQGHPPVYKFWAEQMIVVAGAYSAWARIKAFNKARKP